MWPAFNCGPRGTSCKRVEKNWQAGCPKCELTEVGDRFRDGTKEEIQEVLGGWPEGYDFNKLHGTVVAVSNAQSVNPDRLDPDMDLTFSRLVEILQEERNLEDRIDRLNSGG